MEIKSGDVYGNGKISRRVISVKPNRCGQLYVEYLNDNGELNNCFIESFKSWIRKNCKNEKPSYAQLEIALKRLVECLVFEDRNLNDVYRTAGTQIALKNAKKLLKED